MDAWTLEFRPGVRWVRISSLASRSRHFSYFEFEIVFYFQVLVNFSFYHAKKSLPVYLYINLLFQIITSLQNVWGRSDLDNLFEFELVTMVITCYAITPEYWHSISWHVWNIIIEGQQIKDLLHRNGA